MRRRLFRVTLVGRPNVGKSSLFNALLGYRRSIVLDLAGTTRDEVAEDVDWGEGAFQFVDCFGAAEAPQLRDLESALSKADAVLFVVDAKSGLTPLDKDLAEAVARRNLPTLVIVNKTDAKISEDSTHFSGDLPFEEFAETSATHRRGLSEVRAWIAEQLKKKGVTKTVVDPAAEPEKVVKVAIIGRPNAGKSTLMNRLCGESVSQVSPIPHTTRDPISYKLNTRRGRITLIDTAGIRRPRADKEDVEIFSIQAATRTITDADVILLTINVSEKVTDQDMRLLNLVERSGKPAALLLNFWDLLKPPARKKFWEDTEFISILNRFPTLTISGRTGMNVDRLLPMASELAEKASGRIPTARLNQLVESIVTRNPPPSMGRGNFNILYASQVKAAPPTFVLFVNRKQSLPASYERYLTETLRNALELKGQSLRIFFRAARGRDKKPKSRSEQRRL